MHQSILCSIYDLKSCTYDSPQPFPSAAAATRAFATGCTNPESSLAKFPQDFALHHLATFDHAHGQITSNDRPLLLANAVEFAKQL